MTIRRIVSSVARVAAGCLLVPALAAQNAVPDSVSHRIDAVFARYTPDGPGCAVGVYQNAHIVFAKGYGSANIEYGVPLTPQTPMIMGSVSKQFTAASIALLVEQGRISLHDDVRKYVPELPDYGTTVTIDNLVHHTSGIRDFWALVDASGIRPDDGYTVPDILALAARQKHLSPTSSAGARGKAYSNTGYVLLGVIVQRVTGLSLRQFAAERIFTPLGMTHSHFHDDHNEPVRGRAFAYAPVPRGGWTIDVWNNDIVGQGGLMTTIEDLQKWDENFYTGAVGGKSFLARQLEQGKLNDGSTLAYAFGLEVGAYRGLPMVEHSGSTGGYRTDITRFPGAHTSVVTMCNVSTANSVGLAHQVADAVLGARFPQPVPSAPLPVVALQQALKHVTLSPADVASMAGRYYSEELGTTYELVPAGNVLVLHRPRAAADTLQATDATTLRGRTVVLRFTSTGGPKPAAFTLEYARARGMEFTRVPARVER